MLYNNITDIKIIIMLSLDFYNNKNYNNKP